MKQNPVTNFVTNFSNWAYSKCWIFRFTQGKKKKERCKKERTSKLKIFY